MKMVIIILSIFILILAAGLFISRLKLSRFGIVTQGEVRRKVKRLMPGTEEVTDKSDHLEIWYIDPNGAQQTMTEQNSLLTYF